MGILGEEKRNRREQGKDWSRGVWGRRTEGMRSEDSFKIAERMGRIGREERSEEEYNII